MPPVDKAIAAGRRNSQVLLVLLATAAVVTTSEATRWLTLAKARTTTARWLVDDAFIEDFEDWWETQEHDQRSIAEPYEVFATGRLNADYEHYYSDFGSSRVLRSKGADAVSITQPSRHAQSVTFVGSGLPNIRTDTTDLRADIPDLRPWTMRISPSPAVQAVTRPLSADEASVLVATVGIARALGTASSHQADQGVPAHNLWRADKRWTSLNAERDQAFLQLVEIARSSDVAVGSGDVMPALYRSIERKVGAAVIKVPVLDLELPSLIALWSIGALSLLITALLYGSVAAIRDQDLSQREEDWLLLDAKKSVPVSVARGWVLGICIAPMLISTGILLVVVLRWTAAEGSAAPTAVAVGISCVAILAGSYLSIMTCRGLLTSNPSLGLMRRTRASAPPQPPVTPED